MKFEETTTCVCTHRRYTRPGHGAANGIGFGPCSACGCSEFKCGYYLLSVPVADVPRVAAALNIPVPDNE